MSAERWRQVCVCARCWCCCCWKFNLQRADIRKRCNLRQKRRRGVEFQRSNMSLLVALLTVCVRRWITSREVFLYRVFCAITLITHLGQLRATLRTFCPIPTKMTQPSSDSPLHLWRRVLRWISSPLSTYRSDFCFGAAKFGSRQAPPSPHPCRPCCVHPTVGAVFLGSW